MRANVLVRESDHHGAGGAIFLYTHSGGYEWPERLREALSNCRDRWNDDAYLTRYLASSMFADLTGTTGGGISTFPSDNDDRPFIVVDVERQVIGFLHEAHWSLGYDARREFDMTPDFMFNTRPFAEFCSLEHADWSLSEGSPADASGEGG